MANSGARNNLLKALGLYLKLDCIPRDVCGSLVASMLVAPGEAASVYVGDTTSAVRPAARRTRSVDPSPALDRIVRDCLDARRPDLARHFNVTLEACEPPQYLVYETGGFFRPHVDTRARTSTTNPEDAGRLVSAVLFLNASDADEPGDYAGGALSLYDLVDDPRWRGVGFPCDAMPGLLIAFRADTLHEVSPVTRGTRCTVVTWFR